MYSQTEDHLQAIAFALRVFDLWADAGRLPDDRRTILKAYYEEQRTQLLAGEKPACPHLYPPTGPETPNSPLREWRYLYFLLKEMEVHVAANRVSLQLAHMAEGKIQARIRKLRSEAEVPQSPPVMAQAVESPKPAPVTAEASTERPSAEQAAQPTPETPSTPQPSQEERPPRPSLLERLLDPKSIQYLMMFGGALLVFGLAIWLVAEGFFQNALAVAVSLGALNLAVLAGGAAVMRYTRYETAGRGIALLACLAMPLNLWFYDSQGLVTLGDGGHLWIPALLCCVIYAAVARLVRDPSFVYMLIGGVTLTGLLILADHSVARFWEIGGPSTLLVAIGLLAIHAEWAFVPGKEPFSRESFGRAFFLSGHVVMASGLVLLLGARITGYLHGPLLSHFDLLSEPAIMTSSALKGLALVTVGAATYGYIMSAMMHRRRAFAHVAVLTLLWSEVLLIDLLPIPLTEEIVVLLLAATALMANIAQSIVARRTREDAAKRRSPFGSRLATAASSLALLLTALPVAVGVLVYLRSTYEVFYAAWEHEMGWSYVLAMVMTAVSCRFGAYVQKGVSERTAMLYFFGAAASTVLAAIGLLAVLGVRTWDITAPIVMLVPIGYLVASRFHRPSVARPLSAAAHIATDTMVVAVIAAALQLTPERRFEPVISTATNVWLALFFVEAAVAYALHAWASRKALSVYLSAACGCGAAWQLLQYAALPEEMHILAFAAIGLATLAGYRFALVERFASTSAALAAFRCGNALLLLAGVAGLLFTLNGLPDANVELSVLGMLGALAVASLVAAGLVSDEAWRRTYFALAVAQGAVGFLAFTVATDLTILQKLQLFALSVGTLLLIGGHIGWYRENEEHHDIVSVTLFLGSVTLAAPFILALSAQRFTSPPDFVGWGLFNELGALAVGLILIVIGIACRVRSTTLGGAATLIVYFATLLCFVRLPESLQRTAVYVMIGGALVFACGLVLSICRDRILALPERFREKEGLFGVLKWR